MPSPTQYVPGSPAQAAWPDQPPDLSRKMPLLVNVLESQGPYSTPGGGEMLGAAAGGGQITH
jgi:hypothetical protein